MEIIYNLLISLFANGLTTLADRYDKDKEKRFNVLKNQLKKDNALQKAIVDSLKSINEVKLDSKEIDNLKILVSDNIFSKMLADIITDQSSENGVIKLIISKVKEYCGFDENQKLSTEPYIKIFVNVFYRMILNNPELSPYLIVKQIDEFDKISQKEHSKISGSLDSLHGKVDNNLINRTSNSINLESNPRTTKIKIEAVSDLRVKSISVTKFYLIPERINDYYVDRGGVKLFVDFLNSSGSYLYPIFGEAGIGKTWEIQEYLEALPSNYIPIIVNARLSGDIVNSVASELVSVFDELSRYSNDFIILLKNIKQSLPDSITVLIVIDGLNEYHFKEEDEFHVKSKIYSLFNVLAKSKVKTLFSCRTFTWDNFLNDDSLLTYCFISEKRTRNVLETYYDATNDKIKTREKIFEDIIYGRRLEEFTEMQSDEYWQNVKKYFPLPKWLSNESNDWRDPFLCGLVVLNLARGKSSVVTKNDLLGQYIEERCRDKSGISQSRELLYLLENISSKLISSNMEIKTYLFEDDILNNSDQENYKKLLNTSLIRNDIYSENGRQIIMFLHDRVLEYLISSVLSRNIIEEHSSAQEQYLKVFLLLKLSQENKTNDYLRNIAKNIFLIIYKKNNNNFSKVNPDIRRVFNAFIQALNEPVPDSIFTNLAHVINKEPYWGTMLAFSLNTVCSPDTIDKLLNYIISRSPSKTLISNALLFCSKANCNIVIKLVVSALKFADYTIKIRVAYALAKIQSHKAIEILKSLIDYQSSYFDSLNNACLYSLGLLKYELEDDEITILISQTGSNWRMVQYGKAVIASL